MAHEQPEACQDRRRNLLIIQREVFITPWRTQAVGSTQRSWRRAKLFARLQGIKDDFKAHWTKQPIESFPPFDKSDLESDTKWSGYEGNYRAQWVADPVQHRAETDRNITPTSRQTTGNLQPEQAAARAQGESLAPRIAPVSTSREDADWEAESCPSEHVIPAGTDTVVISGNAEGIGGRWDTFQSRLRERRYEAVAPSRTCCGEVPSSAAPRALKISGKRLGRSATVWEGSMHFASWRPHDRG